MAFLSGLSGPNMARSPLPWDVPAMNWPVEQAVGRLYTQLAYFWAGHERQDSLFALDCLVKIEETLKGLEKAGHTPAGIEAAAEASGLRLGLAQYVQARNAYVKALLEGEIGEWTPEESNYPKYIAFRNAMFKRRIGFQLQPKVQAPGMANERRLAVGNAPPGAGASVSPAARLQANLLYGPSRPYEVGGVQGQFANNWSQRKVVADYPMKRTQRGNIVHAW